MQKKIIILLGSIMLYIVFIGAIQTYANGFGNRSGVGAGASAVTKTIAGTNSVSIQTQTSQGNVGSSTNSDGNDSGSASPDGNGSSSGGSNDGDNGSSSGDGSGGGNGYTGPACFTTTKRMSASGFAEKIYESMVNQIDTNGGNFEVFQEMTESLGHINDLEKYGTAGPTLAKSDLHQELESGTIRFAGGSGYEAFVVSDISGDNNWLKDSMSYVNGNLEGEGLDNFQNGSAYVTYPNPKAQWGAGTYCGVKPAGVSVYVSTQHVQGEPITSDIIESALSSTISIDLNEVGKNQFQANISIASSGMAPLRAKNITWVWTMRVPSEDEPTSMTQSLKEAGKPTVSSGEVKSRTTFNVNVSGGSSVQSAGEVAGLLCNAFNTVHDEPGSSCSGNTMTLSPTHNLFDSQTDTQIKALMNHSSKSSIGGNDASVMNVASVKNNGSLSDTFNANQFIDDGGKYIVGVSAIVNGEYVFDLGDGRISMNIPIGYVSAVNSDTSFTCSQIQRELNSLNGEDLTDNESAQKLFDEFDGTNCQEVQWIPPTAIADVVRKGGNQVQLSSVANRGTIKITRTYVFDGQTDTREECEMVMVNGEEEEQCEDITFVDGYDSSMTETRKEYPIVSYMWEKEGRVYDPDAGEYEIALNGETFKYPSIVGELNNGTTYACLKVITSAPRANVAGGNYPPGDFRETYSKLKGIDYIENRNIRSCDYIRSVEDNRVIHENWG